ncbi:MULTISPECIES: ferredoxin--NADP reductase [Rhodococcus]|uniref:Oxidoreductase n=1 Tax=Rhodococcus pyridinivorans KG-16 TaxID=1441730 RepID=A0A0V9UPZ7_9NOCA|nr:MULTISPECIES: ferredoxin--NADP reductase [Rhodococcus]KSZ60064.1 oxidoreductase [Rhodococcus pyridinivorans KG-16]BDB62617.1 ferredoxin [Rhodococcus sp. RDE2]
MARPPLFQRATVTRIVKETDDARTYVLAPLDGPFTYRSGQFCTFKVNVDGTDLYRSYSMSSAPETDTEMMTTVKRVTGGAVSNWLHDNIAEGDEVEITRPAGTFLLRDAAGPVLGFAGGSGITPILSLAKSALATTDRPVRLLIADRDRASAIFASLTDELVDRYAGRLEVVRHFDDESGLLTPDAVRAFVGSDGGADSYLCGPEAFMDMVEAALPGPGNIYSERFGSAAEPIKAEDAQEAESAPSGEVTGTVSIRLGNQRVSVPRHAGETLLESARRAGLAPPFSCEAGNCATCIAKVTHGSATMRVNDALSEEEIADGYILTCQGVPDSEDIKVKYV